MLLERKIAHLSPAVGIEGSHMVSIFVLWFVT